MRTELVWEGKYDENGRRRPVDIAGSAMPMQKIETVDKPRSEALALVDAATMVIGSPTMLAGAPTLALYVAILANARRLKTVDSSPLISAWRTPSSSS